MLYRVASNGLLQNELLAVLPKKELERIGPSLELVRSNPDKYCGRLEIDDSISIFPQAR
jgi:hypothetical protein